MSRKALERSVLSAPSLPGVYRFLDHDGKILYIGKARDLGRRLRGHLSSEGDARHRILLDRAEAIEWTVTGSEVEALILEAELVRLHKPPLNVMLKSSNRYPWIEVTSDEEFPRLVVTRNPDRSRDVPRFGPYPDARNLRSLVDFLLDAYPLRKCSTAAPEGRSRPCLMGQLGRCPAPCTGRAPDTYRSGVESILRILRGDWEWAHSRLRELMETSSAETRFEDAARWRDLLARLGSFGWPAPETPGDRVGRDVAVVRENWGLITQVRGGRFTGVLRMPFTSRWKLAAPAECVSILLRTHYMDTDDVPREILIEEPLPDAGALEELLSGRRGSKVRLRVPERGPLRELVEIASRDLAHFLAGLEWKRPGRRRERAEAAMEALADLLGLGEKPVWIVGLDASTIQGSWPVAALVSFRDGFPDRSGYRRYSMEASIGRNDPAMIGNAVARFVSHLEDETPGVFLVDGGVTQLRAALEAAGERLAGTRFVALAKKEEVLLDGADEREIRLPLDSPPLLLLRSIRDEAHRFVLHYHRMRRSSREIRSELDDVPGIGPAFRAQLLGRFGSVDRIRSATPEEICRVPGIGRKRALMILAHLSSGTDRTGQD